MTDNNHSDDVNDKREEQAHQAEADKAKPDQELNDSDLDNVSGGALLLPAVQAAREAARRSQTSG